MISLGAHVRAEGRRRPAELCRGAALADATGSDTLAYATGTAAGDAGRLARAFTLIELLVVIAIIGIITAITVPAIRSLSKSNDQAQATSLVRSMISNARSIALSEHRMAGVVFFEESATYSLPVHRGQSAMQLFVEDYAQSGFFRYYSTARQYLPEGIKLAALTDVSANVETGDTGNALAILFGPNGELTMRGGLVTISPTGTPGTYPMAYGDWKFNGSANAHSYPGFFLYSLAEYQAGGSSTTWLKNNSSAVIVNANTGEVLK